MRKEVAACILSFALLAGGPASSFAADDDNVTRSGYTATTGEQLGSSFVGSGNQLLPLKRLDLDKVLDLALHNSYNLRLLGMKLTALSQKERSLQKQKDKLDDSTIPIGSGSLPATPEELKAVYGIEDDGETELWLGPVSHTNQAVNQVMQGMSGIAAALNQQIASQREQVKLALDQMETEQSDTLIDMEKARTGAQLQITSQYVQLLSLDKQIDLNERYLKVLIGDYDRAVTLKQEAIGSAEDIRAAQRLVRDQEKQLDTLRDNYKLALVQLCFDLGLAYDPEITLQEISYNPEPVTRKDTTKILANSYDMKHQWNAVFLANNQEIHTNAPNEDEENYLYTMTRIANVQAEQTSLELSKKISKTYSDAETAYKAYQNAAEDLTDTQVDYANMEVRYKNGFVSRYDFNKYGFTLTQQEAALDLTRLQAFMADQAVKAMEKGLIN
ncbi:MULTISPECIES: TolC family protein [unclassified Paenibacillus]|uniref:TolC family protein n=1 Tax=unclassified Paenibacillus TaxID=185978 RepID=UPI001C10FA45|nr:MULTISPECIES: TolC family protein [unclassified Paenibacillus]MBU5442296.1 TolC family protein [Paenibacillus sp. MSJ-34]CAH0121240.1 hypothetical protein PAE9249_03766 [Paenibacillus sp. CECT 9249]